MVRQTDYLDEENPNTLDEDYDEFDPEDRVNGSVSRMLSQSKPSPREMFNMPLGELWREFIERIPFGIVALFDMDEIRRKMLTRTPRHALESSVWADVVKTARDDPEADLLATFFESFDLRLIALDGQGRNEALKILTVERLAEIDNDEGAEVGDPDEFR